MQAVALPYLEDVHLAVVPQEAVELRWRVAVVRGDIETGLWSPLLFASLVRTPCCSLSRSPSCENKSKSFEEPS